MDGAGVIETYLRQFPLPVMYVSRAGVELFATKEARRQCEIWNRGLLRDGGGAHLPASVEQLARDARRSAQTVLGDLAAKSGWSVRHPRHADSYLRIEEYRPVADGAPAGYWIWFMPRSEISGERPAAAPAPDCLTPRERKVAQLTAQGLSNAEIALAIGRSIRTVEFQLGAVYRKLGVRRRTQLVIALAARA